MLSLPIERSVRNKSTIGLLEALPGYLPETELKNYYYSSKFLLFE